MRRLFLLVWLAAASAASAAAPPVPALGESSYGVFFGGERTGFYRQKVAAAGEGFVFSADSFVRMRGLGFSREATVREEYTVRRDLTLSDLSVRQTLDGTPMTITGKGVPEGVRLTVVTSAGTKERLLKSKQPVYPPPAVNLYPLLKGFVPGKSYTLKVLDVEEQKVREVKVTAVAKEKLPDGRTALHLRNNLYPVSNDVWISETGETVRESVMNGMVETVLEDPSKSAEFLSETALSRRDMILDFSLVRTEPIPRHQELKRLVVEITGLPQDFTLPGGPGQKAVPAGAGKAKVELEPAAGQKGAALVAEEREKLLEANDRIVPDNPAIAALARKITAEAAGEQEKATAIARWVSANIGGSGTDTISPIDTLEKKEGNCQAHTRLYLSLARAVGIPSRFVSGLVYFPDKGFLYHCWAESHVGRWLPLDPTFGQIPVDATHIRLAEGDSPQQMIGIARLVGKIGITVLEKGYQESR